jgi:hypothetical protein
MLTIYFCLDDGTPPVVRYWPTTPKIGDTIALPEFGGNLNLLKVHDIVWEGSERPSVSVYLSRVAIDQIFDHADGDARRDWM